MHRFVKSGSRLLLPCVGVLLAAGLVWGLVGGPGRRRERESRQLEGGPARGFGPPSPTTSTRSSVTRPRPYEVWCAELRVLVGAGLRILARADGLATELETSEDGKV